MLDLHRALKMRFGGDMMLHEADSAALDALAQHHKGNSSGASPTKMQSTSGCHAAPSRARTRRLGQLPWLAGWRLVGAGTAGRRKRSLWFRTGSIRRQDHAVWSG